MFCVDNGSECCPRKGVQCEAGVSGQRTAYGSVLPRVRFGSRVCETVIREAVSKVNNVCSGLQIKPNADPRRVSGRAQMVASAHA